MKLSEYALNELVDYIRGDANKTVYKSGRDLVRLFNKYGQKDLYDLPKGGLPKLDPKQTLNTSRKDYTFDRLKKINESINLKKIIEDVINQEGAQNVEEAITSLNPILAKEGYRLEFVGGKYEIIGAEEDEEIEEVAVTFEKIQEQILSELDKAKSIVYIAVAWFTNDILFQKLIELKQKGVNIQVIIIDDEINRLHGCNIEAEFESRRIPLYGFYSNNKMHNKYCVIDLKTVISGSYNWTKSAEYNNENIVIIKSRKISEEFACKFIELKTI